jgi:hypothetical protein
MQRGFRERQLAGEFETRGSIDKHSSALLALMIWKIRDCFQLKVTCGEGLAPAGLVSRV